MLLGIWGTMVISLDTIIIRVGDRRRILLLEGCPLSWHLDAVGRRMGISSDYYIVGFRPIRLSDAQIKVYQTMRYGDLIHIGLVHPMLLDTGYPSDGYILYHDGERVWAYLSILMPISVMRVTYP